MEAAKKMLVQKGGKIYAKAHQIEMKISGKQYIGGTNSSLNILEPVISNI